jgi:hypothetical protein
MRGMRGLGSGLQFLLRGRPICKPFGHLNSCAASVVNKQVPDVAAAGNREQAAFSVSVRYGVPYQLA